MPFYTQNGTILEKERSVILLIRWTKSRLEHKALKLDVRSYGCSLREWLQLLTTNNHHTMSQGLTHNVNTTHIKGKQL
jgi:hypothetical protein